MYWVDWLVALGFCVAAFLPVLTLRSRTARLSAGVVALVAGALSIHFARLASVDWGFVVYGLFVVLLRAVLACLFLVGIAGAVSRRHEQRTGRTSPWWISPAVLVALLVLAFVVVPTVWAGLERAKQQASFREIQAAVATARDSAEAQTQAELAHRVIGALSASKGSAEADSVRVADRLVKLWHPGALRAMPLFLENDMPEKVPDHVRPVVQNEVDATYGVWARENEDDRRYTPRPGDQLQVTWGAAVELTAVGEYWRNGLFFYDDKGYDYSRAGGWTTAAKPLFPDGRFLPLNVSVVREGKTTPLLLLHAVDDGGKWWLVSVSSVITQPLE